MSRHAQSQSCVSPSADPILRLAKRRPDPAFHQAQTILRFAKREFCEKY
jgi:hypothetical protein